jgi:hypothetical protein
LVQRKNRKAKKKVVATSSAYESFKRFLADKGSKILLKYIIKNSPDPYDSKRSRTFPEIFSSIFKDMEKSATEEEKYLINLLKRFGEIDSSLESLRSVPVYLKYFPKRKSFAKAGITERKYMIYHIENYFQEIYILKERMNRFFKFLSRRFKKGRQTQTSNIMGGCLEAFESEYKKVINIRCRHVHEERYMDVDLWTLTLFDDSKGDHQLLKVGYHLLLLSEKSRWIKWIDQNNKLLTFMLGEIFKVVNKYVIEQ